jgi:type IV pilus assembly protein PilM
MLFDLFDTQYQHIGFHMSSVALKCLELEFTHGGTKIKGYGKVPFPKGAINGDHIADRAAVLTAIKHMLERPGNGSFTTNRVVVSIPEPKSFIRVITMPLMADTQIESAILFEAEAYIPLPMDQVYFDWQVIRRLTDSMEVLIIASPKDYVDGLLSLLGDAGLKVAALEVESQSVVRALIPAANSQLVLIADIDAVQTDLIMVDHSMVQFTSSVPFGGNNFTDKMTQILAMKPADAETLKRQYGLVNTTEYPNLRTNMLPEVGNLASEIKNILKFHYEHSEAPISHVLLTGGGSKLKHLDEAVLPLLSEFPGIEVITASPLQNIPELLPSDLSPYEALSYTTAIGLALRNANTNT